MNIDTKMLIVDAIKGRGLLTWDSSEECVRLGLARYTGNQHNMDWDWNRGALEMMDEDWLIKLYEKLVVMTTK